MPSMLVPTCFRACTAARATGPAVPPGGRTPAPLYQTKQPDVEEKETCVCVCVCLSRPPSIRSRSKNESCPRLPRFLCGFSVRRCSWHILEAAALAEGRSPAPPVRVGPQFSESCPCFRSVISSTANQNKIRLCHQVPRNSQRFFFSDVSTGSVLFLSTQHWARLCKSSVVQVCKVSRARLLQMAYLGPSVKKGSF